ncbi:MAG: hypothetical protein IBJ11_04140 [Phycisphaerales bacterium]|nr:hypothetical protein [Phycisphaerales bacterium]
MASPRLMARLVGTLGAISSGAVASLRRPDAPAEPGLAIAASLLRLLAETVSVQSNPDSAASDEAERFIADLTYRYGTVRRSIDALAAGRRRHRLISPEKAAHWAELMSAQPTSIDPILRTHGALMVHITRWIKHEGDAAEQRLDAYWQWLDAPIESAGAQHAAPADDDADAQPTFPPGEVSRSPVVLVDDSEMFDPTELGFIEAFAAARASPAAAAPADAAASPHDTHVTGEGDAQVLAAWLEEKRVGEAVAERELPAEARAAAERLKGAPDPLHRTLSAVCLRATAAADSYLAALASHADVAKVLTLKGDRFYLEGRFDEAVDAFREARSRGGDYTARTGLAVSLIKTSRGVYQDNFQEAVNLLRDILAHQPTGSPRWHRAASLLGQVLMQAPAGQRDRCCREAISCFETILKTLDRHLEPHAWADAHVLLGQALLDTPTGDRAEHTAFAIEHFSRAMEVWTRDAEPERWSAVQNHLGHAWERNPRGSRAENLERAIMAYTAALAVRSRDRHPVSWARLQNNLGNAWIAFPAGDHKSNIERAIACHTAALEVWSRENRRSDWAGTQNNLGNALALLPAEGDERQKNLRRAVACYKSALEVRTKNSAPSEWAATQNNLGNALLQMTPDKRFATIREAIECFERALEVRTRQAAPVEWAKTKANLGLAWARYVIGDRADNLQEAVACYQAALEVLTTAAYPHQHRHVTARLEEAKAVLRDIRLGQP